MIKVNCWDFKKCNHHLPDASQRCPAAFETRLDGVHGGIGAGRACWVVAGTYCGGRQEGTFAAKYATCEKCGFYEQVREEEGVTYKLSAVLLNRLKEGAE